MKRFSLFLSLVLTVICSSRAVPTDSLHIVFVGNSITQGALLAHPAAEAPPATAAAYLGARCPALHVDFSNCGVSGSTTVDFLPVADKLFPRVISAANGFASQPGLMIFSISLGTNDSASTRTTGAPVLPQQYYTNLKVIVDELLKTYPGCKVVLQYPLWYSPTTFNGAMYLQAGLDRLQSYFPMIERLVKEYADTHPGRVWDGDPKAFSLFREHHQEYFTPENGHAGTFYLHPNRRGAEVLGRIWGETILKAAGIK